MTPITEPCVIDGLDESVYHADTLVPGGSLSTTGAKALLRSPAHYRWQQERRVEKAAFDVGHAVHSLVLGVGMEIAVLDFDSFRTKAAQEARDLARIDGKVPVLAGDYAPIQAMVESVLAHPIARSILERPGKVEQSMFAQDPETGVWLRARADWLPDADDGWTVLADLKTAVTAEPQRWAQDAAKYGYGLQSIWYQRVLTLARGDDDTTFVFVIVEKSAPYLVSVVLLDAEFDAISRVQMRRAIDTFKRCRDTDEWPGYAPITHLVGPPRWLAFDEGMVL